MHHATKAMHVEGEPKGWTARVLFLHKPDGTVEAYAPLVGYMTDYRSRSSTWQDTVARGVGLLWDYFRAHAPDDASVIDGQPWRREMFRRFAHTLLTGTIDRDTKHDPLGLFWPHMQRSRAVRLLRAIEDFLDWFHFEWSKRAEANDKIVNPVRPRDGLTFSEMLVWSRLRKISMLEHLKTPTKVERRTRYDPGPRPEEAAVEPVKFFPPSEAANLVFEGHRRSTKRGIHPCNIRDQMIALLCNWGGLRRSEALHLYVQDVTIDPDNPGCALVVLHHPSDAKIKFEDAFGSTVTGTREEFLNQNFGLLPRHLVTRGRYHAGWKGMGLGKTKRGVVHWLDVDAGAIFYFLYKAYVRDVRPRLMAMRKAAGGKDHPFLFVSEGHSRHKDGNATIGDPYSMKAYERNHRAAVLRLGLPHGKDLGTTTHGLRHAYGQTIMELGLGAPLIMRAMHHRTYLAQAVYTAPTTKMVNNILSGAKKKILTEGTTLLGLPGSKDALALLKLSEHITSGGPLD